MYKKQLMFFTSLLVLFSAFFFGCNQDKFDAGIGLVPDSLRLKSSATDTFTVEAYTYKIDSLLTSNPSKVLVGQYTDPILGKINASFVTELIPYSSDVKGLDTNITVIDSLVMYLRYPLSGLRAYGDTIAPIQIDVKRIHKYLSYSETIYSNFEPDLLNADVTPIISKVFSPKDVIKAAEDEADIKWEELKDEAYKNDSTTDLSKIERPNPIHLLSIKLPNDFRDYIKELVINSINGYTTFSQEFNGFYIASNTVSPVPNSISIFDYNDTETKVSLFYHFDTDTVETTRQYTFNLSGATTRFNLFENNNYNASGFLPDLMNPENKQDSIIYVHGLGGLEAKIKFPYLEELARNGLWAVNRAELIMPVENDTESKIYPTPIKLIIKGVDQNGERFFLPEYLAYNQSTNITTYNGASNNDGEYKFDITQYIQKVLKGEYMNNGLILSIPDEATNPSRVVLTSGNHTTNRMKLILTLTKLSN